MVPISMTPIGLFEPEDLFSGALLMAAIGDDALTPGLDGSEFTHGSAEQRATAYTDGYRFGVTRCLGTSP